MPTLKASEKVKAWNKRIVSLLRDVLKQADQNNLMIDLTQLTRALAGLKAYFSFQAKNAKDEKVKEAYKKLINEITEIQKQLEPLKKSHKWVKISPELYNKLKEYKEKLENEQIELPYVYFAFEQPTVESVVPERKDVFLTNVKIAVGERKKELTNEIKQLAEQCVRKYGEDCVEMNDLELIAYLNSLLPLHDLDLFRRYQPEMLAVFRKTAKESLNQLNIMTQ